MTAVGQRFLGAVYDEKTATYRYPNGSGNYPEEMRQAVLMQLDGAPLDWYRALTEKDAWKERLRNDTSRS